MHFPVQSRPQRRDLPSKGCQKVPDHVRDGTNDGRSTFRNKSTQPLTAGGHRRGRHRHVRHGHRLRAADALAAAGSAGHCADD